ncbi:hypothetical protein GCM10007870_25260 [Gluconobacter kondonii]|uniref:Uncharacterized protein n=1 Tax=Gluconobacter kondonii TaxID=941463 RepID=A0ABQ5WTP5_9PROT|nr:hypothetical protein GCM10007870_25260 [Gluconobacter kondonii]
MDMPAAYAGFIEYKAKSFDIASIRGAEMPWASLPDLEGYLMVDGLTGILDEISIGFSLMGPKTDFTGHHFRVFSGLVGVLNFDRSSLNRSIYVIKMLFMP